MAAVVVAVGLASLGLPRLLMSPLPCDSESALEAAYRQQFFLHIAWPLAAALAGYTGFMVSSAGWLYAIGVFFAAISYTRLVPTTRHLERDQQDLVS